MTSPESTSDSSWNTVGIPNALPTDDQSRHQTSLLGIDIATGQMTDNQSLARPGFHNVARRAATRLVTREEGCMKYSNAAASVAELQNSSNLL